MLERSSKSGDVSFNFSIINVASIHGLAAIKGVSSYAAAKGGIHSLTRNLAIEYAPLIRVNSISPGTFLTELVKECYESLEIPLEEIGAKYPMKKIGNPQEIAELVFFLTSDKCTFLTGENIVVDGGITSKAGWAALD